MIIPGRASQTLAASLADETGIPLGEPTTTRFPDGELLVELPESVPDTAVLVAGTVSDAAHIEVLLLQDALREIGVDQLTTVVPYLGYARQDTAFEPGQPNSARAMVRAIGATTDRLITVNPHEEAILEFCPCPATAVSAAPQLATPLPDDLERPVFIAPDAGARSLADTVCEAYGKGEVDHFEKTRHSGRAVEVVPSDATVAHRDVVLVDDIIATAGTMSEAASILRDRDVASVYATCVHPLLSEQARTRLARAGVTNIIGTDTIERPSSRVSAAPAIATALELA